MYVVTTSGYPCDKGAQKLSEHRKIVSRQSFLINEIKEIKIKNNKFLFPLCLKDENPISLSETRERIHELFKNLEND